MCGTDGTGTRYRLSADHIRGRTRPLYPAVARVTKAARTPTSQQWWDSRGSSGVTFSGTCPLSISSWLWSEFFLQTEEHQLWASSGAGVASALLPLEHQGFVPKHSDSGQFVSLWHIDLG